MSSSSLYLHTTSEGASLLRMRFEFLKASNAPLGQQKTDDDPIARDDISSSTEVMQAADLPSTVASNSLMNTLFGRCVSVARPRRMSVVVAMDAWGNLTSQQLANTVEAGLIECEVERIHRVMLSTGGNEFLDAFKSIYPDTIEVMTVDGLRDVDTAPMLFERSRKLAVIQGNLIISHAGAKGRPSHTTSSYGLGQMILRALDEGASTIYVGCTDVYSMDAGAGLAQALNVRFYDAEKHLIANEDNAVYTIASCDLSECDTRLNNVNIYCASDSDMSMSDMINASALTISDQTASAAFQNAMHKFSDIICAATEKTSLKLESRLGSGGGIPFMLAAIANAQCTTGLDLIGRDSDLKRRLKSADLLITGEALFDWESFSRLPIQLCRMAREVQTKAFFFTLKNKHSALSLPDEGVSCIIPLVEHEGLPDDIREDPRYLLQREVQKTVQLLRLGKAVKV